MRAPVIIGNWKMNGDRALMRRWASVVSKDPAIQSIISAGGTIAVCPPAPLLESAHEALRDTGIILGAQCCYAEREGAFTGEISPNLIAEMGASLTLVGHSERRILFGETDQSASMRARAAFRAGLQVVYCIGETETQHREGATRRTLTESLAPLMATLAQAQPSPDALMIAYEPVWAIGTGVTPTLDQIEEMGGLIREQLGPHASSILYGGSVTHENAQALAGLRTINGLLVGRASLDPQGFAQILQRYQS